MRIQRMSNFSQVLSTLGELGRVNLRGLLWQTEAWASKATMSLRGLLARMIAEGDAPDPFPAQSGAGPEATRSAAQVDLNRFIR